MTFVAMRTILMYANFYSTSFLDVFILIVCCTATDLGYIFKICTLKVLAEKKSTVPQTLSGYSISLKL